MNKDEDSELFEDLILKGAIEPAGIDAETGEILFNFTPKMKDVSPEIYSEHMGYINGEVMRLWELGFLIIDLLEDDPIVHLAPKAFQREELTKLSKRDIRSLDEIKRILLG